jgi:hypothetical protein
VCVRRRKRDVLIVERDGGRGHGSSQIGIHFVVMRREKSGCEDVFKCFRGVERWGFSR